MQTLGGGTFDAIVFGEQKPLNWMAGSNGFVRTRDVNGRDETAKPGELTHVAITYAENGRITIYRNGQPYGDATASTDSRNVRRSQRKKRRSCSACGTPTAATRF